MAARKRLGALDGLLADRAAAADDSTEANDADDGTAADGDSAAGGTASADGNEDGQNGTQAADDPPPEVDHAQAPAGREDPEEAPAPDGGGRDAGGAAAPGPTEPRRSSAGKRTQAATATDRPPASARSAAERFRARTRALAKVSAEIPTEVDDLVRQRLRAGDLRDAEGEPVTTRAGLIELSLAALPSKVDALLAQLDDVGEWLDLPAVKLLGGRIDPDVEAAFEDRLADLADAGFDVTRKALLLAAMRTQLEPHRDV